VKIKVQIPVILILISAISAIQVSAVEVSKVDLTPSILLPNDVADGKLYLTSQNEDVKSISFRADGIEITPKFVTEIGTISSGTTYELPFTVKAGKAGIYSVEVLITTKNESKKHIFNVEVADEKPMIVLKKSRLTLNEVNEVEFSVASRINFERVMVEPLFDSEPSMFYFNSIQEASGALKFYPTEKKALGFKISYYNGRNYHESVQEVEVEYENSRGVFLSQNLSYAILPVNDVSTLRISIANLRNDRIYALSVEVGGDSVTFSEKRKEVAYLDPFSTITVAFLFSPEKVGRSEIVASVSYKDEMGNDYTAARRIEFTATAQEIIGISNLDIKKTLEEVKITGDLSNGGISKVRNVLIEVFGDNITKNLFVGELDAGDFFTFDFTLKPDVKEGVIRVSWTNELGVSNSISKDFKVHRKSIENTSKNTLAYIGIAAIIVGAIIVVAILKSRK